VLHHGICHTREQFEKLIAQLNKRGLHAAMIDQQSENAGFFRNCIGANQYREGMAAAIRAIEGECQSRGLHIRCYVLHSMGAMFGEEMQQQHSELRRPTVLMAPIPANGALPVTLRLLWNQPLAYFLAVLKLDIQSLARTPQQVREVFFDAKTPDDIVETTTKQLKHAPFWVYCQLVLRWLVRPWIVNDGLSKRMLLFNKTDFIFHEGEFDKTRKLYAPVEEHLTEGGHDFFIQYADKTADWIASFYQQYAAEPGPYVPPPHPPRRLNREGLNDGDVGGARQEA
jgi:hypothetical protein